MKTYVYGMRLRGFSPGCQPIDGLIGLADYASSIWDTKRYCDCLEYSRPLTKKELADYELDYVGEGAR